jgi:hypothetical protein
MNPIGNGFGPQSRRSSHELHRDTEKRHRSIEHPFPLNDPSYEPEALPVPMKAPPLQHGFCDPMALPQSALNAYFIDDPSIQNTHSDTIKRGWELFRRIRFYEAVTTYSLDELIQGHAYLSQLGLIEFYGKIHKDHIQRYRFRRK